MARVYQPTARQEKVYRKWASKLPPAPRAAAERLDPWTLYLLKTSGHRVAVKSFLDDGTITVVVSGDFNKIMFERDVFDVSPDDLEECDLPGPSEELGAQMTPAEAHDNIDFIRATVRPDLFVLDDKGKAVRRN